jgi:2-keto-4-pentenoate hydratase/2-oxohepta-3-ene-1,7-dioic acid hydratase in catechol pathway
MTGTSVRDAPGGRTGWGLGTYRVGSGPDLLGAVRFADNSVVAVPGPAFAGLIAAMPHWAELTRTLAGWDPAGLPAVEGAHLLTPLRYPRKLLCTGANYRSHLTEMGAPTPGADWQAWFFLKPPTTTVIGSGVAIEIDADPDEQVDWEGELGLVIGRGGRHIRARDAAEHVAGFVNINDISARGPHYRTSAPHDAFSYDWLASKAQDTFCPMGPAVVPRWLIGDPEDLRLRLWVNDELQQDERTGDMIVGWRDIIEAASSWVTLEPGDVIATGTPAGVGVPRGTFLRPGDIVRMEIDGLGVLENPVVARTGGHRQPTATRSALARTALATTTGKA